MQLFADLHIHSCFSLATSSSMVPGNILSCCRKKGIGIVGSGDALHPGWQEQWESALPGSDDIVVVPTTEVEDADRVHHLILMESFDDCRDLSQRLSPGSPGIVRTGRPHLRMKGEEIARAVHECGGLIGPAHAFTPWTSLYASFDRPGECYGSEPIDFLELGLSADSSYGAGIPDLHDVPFLSCSDAHSPDPARLGREFTGLSVRGKSPRGVVEAVRKGRIAMNAGFFPEEGKYNRTACCRCFRQFSPIEATLHRWRCPDDRRSIKKGVADRAAELSSGTRQERPPYLHIIPLGEIIRTVLSVSSPQTVRCRNLYEKFVGEFGDEIRVLTEVHPDDLSRIDTRVASVIEAFRGSRIRIVAGGGGKYGSFLLPE